MALIAAITAYAQGWTAGTSFNAGIRKRVEARMAKWIAPTKTPNAEMLVRRDNNLLKPGFKSEVTSSMQQQIAQKYLRYFAFLHLRMLSTLCAQGEVSMTKRKHKSAKTLQ